MTSLTVFIFSVMMVNKCLTYAVALSVEVTLNYQTSWITAQACQQWRLELMTHEKQSPRPGSPRPARAPTPPHIINIPIIVMSTLPPTSKDTTRTVNLLNFPPSSSSVSGGHPLPCCFTVSHGGLALSLEYTEEKWKSIKCSKRINPLTGITAFNWSFKCVPFSLFRVFVQWMLDIVTKNY